jgi:hypothetical protein
MVGIEGAGRIEGVLQRDRGKAPRERLLLPLPDPEAGAVLEGRDDLLQLGVVRGVRLGMGELSERDPGVHALGSGRVVPRLGVGERVIVPLTMARTHPQKRDPRVHHVAQRIGACRRLRSVRRRWRKGDGKGRHSVYEHRSMRIVAGRGHVRPVPRGNDVLTDPAACARR